jgi:capsular polysaccharide biosynthesis protein
VSVRQGDAVAPERVGIDVLAAGGEAQSADLTVGLVSLRFIGTALRRRAWAWCAVALAGMVIGLGLLAVVPPAYQASASVLMTNDPTADPGDASQTNLTMAQTYGVAQGAERRLGLRQSVASFQASYTITIVNPQILLIAATAPSSSQAVARADAVAAEVLQFRAAALQAEEQNVLATLGQQIATATQQLKSITDQMAALPTSTTSPAQLSKLHDLQAQGYKAETALVGLEHIVASYPVTIAAMVASGRILDVAVPARRGHQAVLFYPLSGLFLGLLLGLGIVIVGALTSDCLRRRDDVAQALGIPVKLSVRNIHAHRWLPGRLRLAVARGRDTRRIAAYLRRAVPAGSGDAALAAVSVDNARAVALPLVALALSCARDGKRVVLADLSGRTPAARLLGVRKPGVHEVRARGARLVVAVPGRDVVAPAGPLPVAWPIAQPGSATEALAAACDSADVLLTLVGLNPVLGAEHVASWATNVIVMVTAGRSSPVKIHAVGEMIRLAGIPQTSAVLIGADKADVSLGVTWAPNPWRQPAQPAQMAGVSR